MILNFRTLGAGHPLIILHGIFGSSDNWQSQAKVLAEKYKVYLVDLRNHGNSFHADEFHYGLMSNDILALMEAEGLSEASILGHSMGGKVAMHVACRFPEKIRQLIVVDIAPRHYLPHHQQIFEGFHSVQLSALKSRKEADEQMAAKIGDFGVRQFILKNLYRNKEGQFSWKLNLSVIEKNIEQVGAALPEVYRFDKETLFIRGSKSDYIRDEDKATILKQFPKASIETVTGAGHWVHAEKPADLLAMVTDFLLD